MTKLVERYDEFFAQVTWEFKQMTHFTSQNLRQFAFEALEVADEMDKGRAAYVKACIRDSEARLEKMKEELKEIEKQTNLTDNVKPIR